MTTVIRVPPDYKSHRRILPAPESETRHALQYAAKRLDVIDGIPGIGDKLTYFELSKIKDFARWLEELAARP